MHPNLRERRCMQACASILCGIVQRPTWKEGIALHCLHAIVCGEGEEYLAGEGAEEEASFGGSKVRGLGDGKADRADDTSESVKEPMISTRAKKTIVEAADSSSKTPVIDEDENAAKQEKGRDGVVFYKFWLLINATPGR